MEKMSVGSPVPAESERDKRKGDAWMEEIVRSCIDCGSESCELRNGKNPPFCLTTHMDEALLRETMALYTEDGENAKVTKVSAEVETEYYCKATRIEEIVQFAKRMGFQRIGIATCIGLLNEARIAARVFRKAGFEVYGAACKVGSQRKTSVGIPKECEAVGEVMCNPILQAKLLNQARTDLNVVIGLCVGHDSLFYKYSEALATTLVTKDRVLGHNPAAALYQAEAYYSRLLKD